MAAGRPGYSLVGGIRDGDCCAAEVFLCEPVQPADDPFEEQGPGNHDEQALHLLSREVFVGRAFDELNLGAIFYELIEWLDFSVAADCG
jgi:hypothetical protein